MSEWKVIRNGRTWTDSINSEDLAYAHISECVANGEGSEEDYTVEEMSEEEIISSYYPTQDYCDYCLLEKDNKHLNGYNFEDAKYCRMCGRPL